MKLITKSYPSLVDIYERREVYNEELGSHAYDWDYTNFGTIYCNVTSLKPESSLEVFSETYTRKLFAKLEFPNNDIKLSNQVGNIRSKDGKQLYYTQNNAIVSTMIFNVSSMNTQVDVLGNLVCHTAYLEYTGLQDI
ncbi:hypothetical protein O1W68_16645 [Rhodococcus sp. H36-A4]|uniref:hypothetical protein n=1 Tax=Rhodococcus sp. H36-A4 TaxID=3004353 RepID=UPI0022AF65EC|nr:hypothetical protein [Rhodococcus sp. H36-A4]MCZ4079579.1 hypothetical protein [Rhodococcus sp. H36-A4]